jgi:hypothetical protein
VLGFARRALLEFDTSRASPELTNDLSSIKAQGTETL